MGGLLDSIEKAITPDIDNGEPSYGKEDYKSNGFIVSAVPSADGSGLPSHGVQSDRKGTNTRHVAHWFVPEVGIIPMFINPQSITYSNKKLIDKVRTKGGFIIQYWGEDLGDLSINGHTGSSGIEGINVLYEIYRAEQFMFDPIALTMAADSSVSGIGDMMEGAIGNIGGLTGTLVGGVGDLLGMGSGQSVLPKDVPSLAAMATGIELYYAGWVHRGYFTSMSITESVEHLGIFKYDIKFTVTQRRGYRLNSFAWQHSPGDKAGKSFGDSGSSTDMPYSYSREYISPNSNKGKSQGKK